MKFNSEVIKKAHKMVKEIKIEYPEVDYKVQFGLCLSYLLKNKEGDNTMKNLNGSEKQIKWAEDIRQSVMDMNNLLLEKVNLLVSKKSMNNAREIYTTSKEVIENIEDSKAFIENFKGILKIKDADKSFEFTLKFRVFRDGIEKLGLESYSKLASLIKEEIEDNEEW